MSKDAPPPRTWPLVPRTIRGPRQWLLLMRLLVIGAVLILILPSCQPPQGPGPQPSPPPVSLAPPPVPPTYQRRGDEISIAGWLFHTGAPVVLWSDPGGLNGYAGENLAHPRKFGYRTDAAGHIVRGNLNALRQVVDQFVLHYDGSGTSKRCFAALVHRGLSVHFMLDLDGTIYQMLDVQEKAYDATIANNRSVGVEIANIGAFEPGTSNKLGQWYYLARDGHTYLRVPPGEERLGNYAYKPMRDQPIQGVIQGRLLQQYDFTPQQYDSLIKLTAVLCTQLPRIRCDYPRDSLGRLYPAKLPNYYLARYSGILGHFHIQTDKTDPGPAMQWNYLIAGARRLMALGY